ncbi:MAG TPA: zinc-dependent peptidase [Chitinophagaceae bacterium]|nr:zinc-dependent peptidase [Chitinophagaceae bacterium]
MAYRNSLEDDKPKLLYPEGVMFLFILFIVFLSAYLYIIRPAQEEKKKRKTYHKTSGPVEKVVQEVQYDHWLSKYNPYYNSLPAELKKRFIYRVRQFMGSKQFYFHAMVEEEYMPVLISAAAVQLTFGLRNYLMDYFDVIHVMRKEYVLNIDKETYYGHVSKNGIHISWNHFLGGYSDYGDSVNLGLHEMAHALQFDVVLGDEDLHDRSFYERLNEFSEEGRPVFRAMRQGTSHLLSDYACTNFDEFWAVSVETFFENPKEFKEKLPNLYREMTELLNQDPLLPGKVVQGELS